MDYLPMTIRKQKNIALIAHDQKKRELIQWCGEHKDIPVSYTHLGEADALAHAHKNHEFGKRGETDGRLV